MEGLGQDHAHGHPCDVGLLPRRHQRDQPWPTAGTCARWATRSGGGGGRRWEVGGGGVGGGERC